MLKSGTFDHIMETNQENKEMQQAVDEAMGMKTIEPEELSVTEAFRKGKEIYQEQQQRPVRVMAENNNVAILASSTQAAPKPVAAPV